MLTDAQVVERLRARDAQAFRSLIERIQQPVTGYLHRLVGDREVALDLAQDTFLRPGFIVLPRTTVCVISTGNVSSSL